MKEIVVDHKLKKKCEREERGREKEKKGNRSHAVNGT